MSITPAAKGRITPDDIRAAKGTAPIACLTAYTTPMAKLVDQSCDVLLVGDSLGMVLHGLPSTLGVTIEMMILHGQAAARGSERACLVVDMSGLDFFDAGGIGALVAVHRELTRQGRHMALAEPTPIAARVLDVLGMDRLFEIYPLVEMALTHTSGLRVDGDPVTADPASKVP